MKPNQLIKFNYDRATRGRFSGYVLGTVKSVKSGQVTVLWQDGKSTKSSVKFIENYCEKVNKDV